MRVLLVDPRPPGLMPPLGLLYVSSHLKKHGHVEVVGRNYHPSQMSSGKIADDVRAIQPDVIGVSCSFTSCFPEAVEILQVVKQALPGVIIVAGGAHVTSNPEQVVQSSCIDYAVVGEGEITFCEFMDVLARQGDPLQVKGLCFMRDGKAVLTDPRPHIDDLDTLAFPDYELFDLKWYFDRQMDKTSYAMRRPVATIVSSRGCPMDCVYCSIRKVWGRKWRARSAANVFAEIRVLVEKYGAREIMFLDDSFSVNRKRVREFCDLVIRGGFDFRWSLPNGIAIWTLDKEEIHDMKAAGCYRLTFGLESGDPETRKFIRKQYSNEHAFGIIREANRLGMWTVATFIIGFPYEPQSAIRNTIRFAIQCHLDFAAFYTATPFPGTEMFTIFETEGLSHPTDASLFNGGCDTKHFTANELRSMRTRAHMEFFAFRALRAWDILFKIRDRETLGYTMRVCGNILRAARKGFRSFF